jgi:hypothetical protein
MSGIATAIVGSTLIGGYMSSNAQEDAANTASGAQMQAARLGTEETRRQFDAVQALLKPYTDAGTRSLTGQQDLLGLNGAGQQSAVIQAIQSSPQFAALTQQGENAILQNASATGGLRGGNMQGALAQFRPALLAEMINQQYSRLGGFTSLGQNSAARVGNAGMNTGEAVAKLLQQSGAAQAGAALAGGRAQVGMWNNVDGAAGMFAGLGGFNQAPAAYTPPTQGYMGSYAENPFMASGF